MSRIDNIRVLSDVLQQHKLIHFLWWGSLLGCVREGAPINHDDDDDIGCYHHDANFEMKTIIPDLELNGFRLIWLMYDDRGMRIERNDRRIDLFQFIIGPNQAILSTDPLKPMTFPKDCIYPSTVLQEKKFTSMVVLIPRHAKWLLHGMYGNTWRIPKKGKNLHYANLYFSRKNGKVIEVYCKCHQCIQKKTIMKT
jgi:hypothetical protein